MKRLIFLALFAIAAWYGWHHYREVLEKVPKHEAVVRNESGETVVRLRLTVCGRTYVKELLESGQSATFPFAATEDSHFQMNWEYVKNAREGRWEGGLVAKGPIVSRHVITLRARRGVVYESDPL